MRNPNRTNDKSYAQHNSLVGMNRRKGKKDMEESTNHEDQLNDIYSKLEVGDISVTEAIKQSNALTAEITAKEVITGVNKHTEELAGEKDFETAEKKFFDDHPDYEELVASGKLQPYIDKNPTLVDEMIAYYQYKIDNPENESPGEKNVQEFGDHSFKRTPKRMEKPLALSEDQWLDRQLKIVGRMRSEIS